MDNSSSRLGYFALLKQYPRELSFGLSHAYFSGLGQTFFIAFLVPFVEVDYGYSASLFGLVYGAITLGCALLIPSVGALVDSKNLKAYGVAIAAILALGGLCMASAGSTPQLFLGLFLIRFAGQGLFPHVATSSAARYFDRERGRALTLVTLGMPLSEASMPLIFTYLCGFYTWQQSLGVMFAALIGFYLLYYVLVLPREHVFCQPVAATEGEAESMTWRQLWSERRFVTVAMHVSLPAFIFTGLFFHKIALGSVKGWSPEYLALCFLMFAGVKTVTALLAGPLIDRYSAMRCARYSSVPTILSIAALATLDSSIGAIAYLAMAGVTLGFGSVMQAALWTELFGRSAVGSVKSVAVQVTITMTALSPPIFGLFTTQGGLPILVWSLVAATVFVWLLAIPSLRQPAS